MRRWVGAVLRNEWGERGRVLIGCEVVSNLLATTEQRIGAFHLRCLAWLLPNAALMHAAASGRFGCVVRWFGGGWWWSAFERVW